jgi:hypothetical protein
MIFGNGGLMFKRPAAWLAAVVALSGFFTSPLTQQAIGYTSDRQVLSNGTATVLRASAFSRSNAGGFKPGNSSHFIAIFMRVSASAVHKLTGIYREWRRALRSVSNLAAAYLGPNQTLPGVDPMCSSGDCDWPVYASLGICAEIVNISASTNSSLLTELLASFLVELRESQYASVFANAGDAQYYLTALLPFTSPSTEFKEAPPQTVISQSVVVHFNTPVSIANDTNLAQIQYIGVSLYFCTQSYSTTVKRGIQNTTKLAYTNNIISRSTTESINSFWNGALYGASVCDPGPETGSTITLGGATGLPTETYTIDFCTAIALSSLYIIGTSGGILLDLNRSVFATVGQISEALGIAVYGDFNSSTLPDPATQYANVKSMMENIGTSLTT